MTELPLTTRRALLLGAAGVTASLAAERLGSWPFSPLAPGSAQERLAALLADHEGASAIGRAYLRTVPAESDARVLTSLLADSLSRGSRLGRMSESALREQLHHRTLDEFRTLRTVEVDGWVLARTEARLCALVAASRA
jgi:hypothetical protein